jgi:hypothetical protein
MRRTFGLLAIARRHPALFTALTLAIAAPAQAGTLGVHLVSRHESRTYEAMHPGGPIWHVPYNNRNTGLYYVTDSGLVVGAYRNSYNVDTVYAGRQWVSPSYGPVRFAATAAVATGYQTVHGIGKLRPMLMPSVLVDTPLGVTVRYSAAPAKGGIFQHLSLEMKL